MRVARATCPSRAATCRAEWVRFTDKMKPSHENGSVSPFRWAGGPTGRAGRPCYPFYFGVRAESDWIKPIGIAKCVTEITLFTLKKIRGILNRCVRTLSLARSADCSNSQRVDSQKVFHMSNASSLGGPAASWDNSRSISKAQP